MGAAVAIILLTCCCGQSPPAHLSCSAYIFSEARWLVHFRVSGKHAYVVLVALFWQ